MSRWSERTDVPRGASYDERWRELEAKGVSIHGEADLVEVDLRRTFDVVAAPGNVMIFLAPGTEAEVVANLARHVAPRGVLVAGFQLSADRLSIEEYDRHAAAVGFELQDRWSTWDREPFVPGPGAGYAVSVHRRS